jgi:hypothetical protein
MAYKNLSGTTGNINNLKRLSPAFPAVLYNTKVDVAGNHLSGLLLIKKMPDSSTRVVFSNEMGFKFFDFEFAPGGNFKVHFIIKQLDKKAVIKTLRKDFEIVLMQQLDESRMIVKKDATDLYYIFPQSKGSNCYITDSSSTYLVKMERASGSKAVVEIITANYINGTPDSIGISHKNFTFNIQLKKIQR